MGLFSRKKRFEDTHQMAHKTSGGWVVLRASDHTHKCRPPDTYREYKYGSGTEKYNNGHVVEMNPEINPNKWTEGDLWLCECGKAWRVQVSHFVPSYPRFSWKRFPAEDVAVPKVHR